MMTIIRCKDRLKNAPLPHETKTPHLINTKHFLVTLIVKHFHESLLHIYIKQTLTELRQKYWICHGRNFVRIAICVENKKFHPTGTLPHLLSQN